MRSIFPTLLFALAASITALSMARTSTGGVRAQKIGELTPTATLSLGKTADWVATVRLPGEPCAGLATGFGSLWIPMCAKPNRLAKVDLAGGITTGAGRSVDLGTPGHVGDIN